MTDTKRKIFIVEDSFEISRMYERAFRLQGYEVELVYDGETALARLQNDNPPPDAILMDIMMPHMNGLELLKAVRNDSRFKKVPIVILTNSIHKDEEGRFLEIGADRYLVKMDNQYKQIVEEVEGLISQRAAV